MPDRAPGAGSALGHPDLRPRLPSRPRVPAARPVHALEMGEYFREAEVSLPQASPASVPPADAQRGPVPLRQHECRQLGHARWVRPRPGLLRAPFSCAAPHGLALDGFWPRAGLRPNPERLSLPPPPSSQAPPSISPDHLSHRIGAPRAPAESSPPGTAGLAAPASPGRPVAPNLREPRVSCQCCSPATSARASEQARAGRQAHIQAEDPPDVRGPAPELGRLRLLFLL